MQMGRNPRVPDRRVATRVRSCQAVDRRRSRAQADFWNPTRGGPDVFGDVGEGRELPDRVSVRAATDAASVAINLGLFCRSLGRHHDR